MAVFQKIKPDSSAIAEFSLTPDGLEVQFTSGGRYLYPGGKAKEAYHSLRSAHVHGRSVGRTFHKVKPSLKLYQRLN